MQIIGRFRLVFFALILGALAIVAGNALQTDAADNIVTSTTVEIIESDDNGMQFTLSVPTAQVSSEGEVIVPGLDGRFSEPGQPDLPHYSTIIALPPEADALVDVVVQDEGKRAVDAIRPIPSIITDENTNLDEVTTLEALGLDQTPDAAIYGSDALFPDLLWELSEPMYIRDLRVVQLTIYPVRYNPVAQTLTEASEIEVSVSFSGASRSAANPAPSSAEFGSDALNYDQAANWRSLPANMNSRATSFPIGVQTLKITVDTDGIYQIGYNDLVTAGMNPANLDTNTLQLMHQNQSVAYQFIGDGDGIFESDEAVRFYGWAFDGTRHDKLYIGDNNVYFLYSGGSANTVTTVNSSSSGNVVNTWRSTITFEEDKFFTTTDDTQWEVSDNEPEAWYWFGLKNGVTKTVSIDVPNPVSAGSSASLLTEVSNTNTKTGHVVDVNLNDTLLQTFTWSFNRNKNLIHTGLPAASLQDGANSIDFWSHRLNDSGGIDFDDILVNRIALTYDRQLTAVNNELAFDYTTAGAQRFQVDGFTQNDPAAFYVWDVSNRLSPTVVNLSAGDITGSAGNYTANIGVTSTSDSHIVASTQLRFPAALSTYTASSLEPAGGQAEWLALAHNTLESEANRLAAHRATFSNLTTHVVDIEDVYNQYGYGFAVPSSVQAFLTHALSNWDMSYALLIGDATENPRKLTCSLESFLHYTTCSSTWNNTDENYVLTDFQFKDRFKGMIATDHTFATLVGNDESEDIAIGRIAAQTSTDLKNTVDKIILFENSVQTGAAYTQNMLWLADNVDLGGPFCAENATVRNNHVTDSSITHKEICANNYYVADPWDQGPSSSVTAEIRTDFYNYLGTTGARIINYRGHGGNDDWAGNLVTAQHDAEWANVGQPGIILSADCLDGNFVKSGQHTLGESFMKLDLNRGSAAHWSSTGLGYSTEHTVLHKGFYDGIYQQGHTRIGDAIQYSKNNYIAVNGGHISEPYSFVLQGDPAMIVVSTIQHVYLPIVIK